MPHPHRTHGKHRQLPRFSLRDALIALFVVLFLLTLAGAAAASRLGRRPGPSGAGRRGFGLQN